MIRNILDLVGEGKIAKKKENKKKLHALLDKYGSVEEIERSGELKDGFELDFARVDGALEEVLEERRRGYREPKSYSNEVLRSNIKSPNSFLPDDEDFSLEGLILNDKQRKVIDKLDMNTQLTVIKALREQQGVEKPKPKKMEQEKSKSEIDVLNERVDKANREYKIADNKYAGIKSDASYVSDIVESKEVSNSIALEKKYSKLLSNVREYLENEKSENLIEYIYLDSKGYITTGIGTNIHDKETFLNIDFMIGDRLATYQEKLDVYNKFKDMSEKDIYKNNYKAQYYKKISKLRINSKVAKELLRKHTLNDLKKLREGIDGFDKLPLPLQEVLMDIKYNTGNISKSKWPKLYEGIRTRNLSLIADNVSRKDVSADRNKWARDKILSIKEKW